MSESGSPDFSATMELLSPLKTREEGERRLRIITLLEERLTKEADDVDAQPSFGRDPMAELSVQLMAVLLLTARVQKTILEVRVAEFDENATKT
jgi:hypothetical protein